MQQNRFVMRNESGSRGWRRAFFFFRLFSGAVIFLSKPVFWLFLFDFAQFDWVDLAGGA